jgi:CRP-like cAMP-binding protein
MNGNKSKVSEVRDFLDQMPLFSGLGEASYSAFTNQGHLVNFRKGEFIFFQGDLSEKFYIVQAGAISILLASSDGREMVINEIRPGDFFGELGVLTKKTRSTSAVARTDSEILVFPGRAFLDLIDSEPLMARRLLEITADRLRSSSERESALAFLDAQARLVRLLLQLDKQELEKGYVTISQGELAQRTGLTRQTVAKALGRWRRAGWLITGRGRILVLNHAAFAQLEKDWLVE